MYGASHSGPTEPLPMTVSEQLNARFATKPSAHASGRDAGERSTSDAGEAARRRGRAARRLSRRGLVCRLRGAGVPRLRRWGRQRLTDVQRREIDRLEGALRELRLVFAQILALADELGHGTIEPQFAKSVLEVGLECLLRADPQA